MKKIFLTAIVILALSLPVFVLAQAESCPPGAPGLKCAGKILGDVADPNKTGLKADLGDTVATVIKAVLALVGTVFLVLTIYAGILWMTAQGEETQITKATGIIKASVIGLVIIMSAYAITYFVTSKLGGATGASNPSTSQTGCCFSPTYIECRQNVPQSGCNTMPPDNLLWQAGPCSSNCTETI